MSIINSLKTFSKKAFNVEPNGSNIDEVLDDMASKVTPGSGSGGGNSDSISVFDITPVMYDEGDQVNYLEANATFNEIEEALTDNIVLFRIKRAYIPGTPFLTSNGCQDILETYSFQKIEYDTNDAGYKLYTHHMIEANQTFLFDVPAASKDEKPRYLIK